MFGTRGQELNYFELSIPETLYADWHKCFHFHRLALESRKSGFDVPIWHENSRISAAATSSIDRSTVDIDSGEMSFGMFDYNENDINQLINAKTDSFEKLEKLRSHIGNDNLPEYIVRSIRSFSPNGSKNLVIHESTSIANYTEAKGLNKDTIQRSRGFIGSKDLKMSKYPDGLHHVKIFYNGNGKAKIFYKYNGNIKYLKNRKSL
jgi:hypothetical protein